LCGGLLGRRSGRFGFAGYRWGDLHLHFHLVSNTARRWLLASLQAIGSIEGPYGPALDVPMHFSSSRYGVLLASFFSDFIIA
jgi:hypothetical protein